MEVNELSNPQESKFNREFEKAIQALLKNGTDPRPYTVVQYIKDHPADFPHIIRKIHQGLGPYLELYLLMWCRVRDGVKRGIELPI